MITLNSTEAAYVAAVIRDFSWEYLGLELHHTTPQDLLEAIYLAGRQDITDNFLPRQGPNR